MDPSLVSIAFIFFLAGLVQGLIGFGFGLVSMSLLVLIVDIKTAVPLVAVFALLSQVQLLLKLYPDIYWKHARMLIIGSMIGAPIGVLLLRDISGELLLFLLGITLILYVVLSWRGHITMQKEINPIYGSFVGLIGGVLGGALNTSGPPAVVYTSAQPWLKNQIISTLQIYFFSTTVVQLITLAATGILGKDTLLLNVKLFPMVLLGVAIGFAIYNRLDQEKFKKWMFGGVLILGLNLIVRNAHSVW
jgi:uncharacterized protein